MLLISCLIIIFVIGTLSSISFSKILNTSLITFLLYVIYNYIFPSSSDVTIGHLIPFSDASGYFVGASRFYHGIPLDEWASRRPIYSVFLSGLLFLAGGSFDLAILFQFLLNFSLIALTSKIVYEIHGKKSAFIFSLITIIFYSRFSLTSLTESLGFQASLLGMLFLLEFAKNKKLSSGLLFFLMISFGLNIRAGSFFIIPLAFLAFLSVIEKNKDKLIFSISSILLTLVPFIMTKIFASEFAENSVMPMSNFSYVLYGLVSGGKGWQFVQQAHPEILRLQESVANIEIYKLACSAFLESPLLLVKGFLVAYKDYFSPSENSMFGFFAYKNYVIIGSFISFVLILFFLYSLRILWLGRLNIAYRVLFAIAFGIFLSVPFVFPKDTDYMRAQACAIPFLALITSISFKDSNSLLIHRPWVKFFPLIYFMIIGLGIFNYYHSFSKKFTKNLVYSPVSLLHIESPRDLIKKTVFFPYQNVLDKLNSLSSKMPLKLTLGYNFDNRQLVWLLIPESGTLELYRKDCNYLDAEQNGTFFPIKTCNL